MKEKTTPGRRRRGTAAPESLPLNPLTALSPLDGRYLGHCAELRPLFSEFGLMRARVWVEVEWLIHLSEQSGIRELKPFNSRKQKALRELVRGFSMRHAERIKDIEQRTRHDMKAVEYFIKESMESLGFARSDGEFVHFACTSWDINNLAYGMILQTARTRMMDHSAQALIRRLDALSVRHADLPMLTRTHGQPASPTTLGKEFANFAYRLKRSRATLQGLPIYGKMNGAVGNFNAHLAAWPRLDWPAIAKTFVEQSGLVYHPMTTQIEPYDYLAELCHALARFNTIVLDLDRDMWGYIALGYFRQRAVAGEVGSSTMPHKINPIDFENSEGNLGVANALLEHFAAKLPVSRWQRDLSDSTVLRNLGVGFGHSLLGSAAAVKGLGRLQPDRPRINDDLEHNWQVLAEAVQTVMRRYGIPNPYEQLAAFTRGRDIDRDTLHAFIDKLDIPKKAKADLLKLTPQTYIGNAAAAAATAADNS